MLEVNLCKEQRDSYFETSKFEAILAKEVYPTLREKANMLKNQRRIRGS
jgi:hypothetical protein